MKEKQEPYVAFKTPDANHAWGYIYDTFNTRGVRWYPNGRPPEDKWWNSITQEERRAYIQADLDKRKEQALNHRARWAKLKPVREDAFEVVSFRYPSRPWDSHAQLTYHGYYTKIPFTYYIYVGWINVRNTAQHAKQAREVDELGAFKEALIYLKRAKERADKRLAAKLRKTQEAEQNAE